MTELVDRLRAALGIAYSVDRELGGGGMSRVFLAEEVALGRRVVVKVLPPEMGAGVNADRFQREVHLAASLQHPHIVPVLSAGASDDLRYYVMPFVTGESLRQRLARHHELPVPEVIQILRDVLDGLASAHERGIVHRDIKPDNILLSGRHALITDFGVSKAVSESSQGSSLTSLGMALGTPAYMAPEQAAGDPHVDARADVYAVGVLAYEMLCGRTPFHAATPQQMLSAHLTHRPEPCTAYRPTVPEPLNALVMRCLEKRPADRPQTAEEVLGSLAQVSTPSGAAAPSMTPVSTGTLAAIARHHPLRLVLISATVPLALLAGTWSLVRFVGLPQWVTLVAALILGLAIPLLLITGRAERQRLLNRAAGTGPVTGQLRHFSWPRAVRWGGGALGVLALATGGSMAMGAWGIGPAATLMSKGLYTARDPLLVVDFGNRTSDSTLALTVTELVRLDLEHSDVVSLVQAETVRDALARMQRPAGTPLTLDLARELARREGVTAILEGDIAAVGASFSVSLRLIAAESGEVLFAGREIAASQDDLMPAVDRLSGELRGRIGESLRRLRGEAPITAVTTPSFEAFRLYAQATRAYTAGDIRGGFELMRRAVIRDTGFADAYRRMGHYFENQGFPRDSIVRAMSKAYRLRERLPPVERALTEASYFGSVLQQYEDAITAYQTVLSLRPEHSTARGNLANLYRSRRQFAAAESLDARLCEVGTIERGLPCARLALALTGQGKYLEADRVAERAVSLGYSSVILQDQPARHAFAQGRFAEAVGIISPLIEQWRESGRPGLVQRAEWWAMGIAFLHGQQGRGRAHRSAWGRTRRALNPNFWPERLSEAYWALGDDIWFERDVTSSHRTFVSALDSAGLENRNPEDRGYQSIAVVLAQSGDTALAREYALRYEDQASELGPVSRQRALDWVWGQLHLAAGQHAEGVRRLRTWEASTQDPRNIVEVAWAYDRAGQADSAEALYRRFLESPSAFPIDFSYWYPRAMRRIGELAEARGDRAEARRYYERFLTLWSDADLEMEPVVRRIRNRLDRL